jgi:hypothetical protein
MKFILSMAALCLSFMENAQASQRVDLYKQALTLRFKANSILHSFVSLDDLTER